MAKPKRKPLAMLSIRLLGDMELWRGERPLALPQSKKTRALLAYLVVTQRAQRRDRLCGLLWDVADDPRAALRWSLSKLRPLVDDAQTPRLVSAGETIAFDPAGAEVDVFTLRAQLAGAEPPPLERLLALAAAVRGPFLEGLELPDFLAFQSWCIGVREEARGLHARLLALLVERLADAPERALPYARTLAQLDPQDESAQVTLLRVLAACDRLREAEQHVQAASRLLELGAGNGAQLRQAWAALDRRAPRADAAALAAPSAAFAEPPRPPAPALVGREPELARLHGVLDAVGAQRMRAAVLLSGEPGIGKTSLLAALAAAVAARGGTVLEGAAYEAESGRPYGPWLDALRRLPAPAIGESLGGDLAPLLPELGAGAGAPSRDRLFGAVVELLAARAHSAPPVLLAFDDVQWCDEASAELLHYAARMSRHRPLLLALAARSGELDDNQAISRLLRGLRHDGGLEEIDVGPLGRDATAALIGSAAAADAERVFAESAGNPLFALEVARSLPHRQAGLPSTLRRLVRDRIDRLPGDAVEVLRWAAVIGHSIEPTWLAAVAGLDEPRLIAAVEGVERHALLRPHRDQPDAAVVYRFAHDVVRQALYGELSEPRRRLMHLRLARALPGLGARDEAIAADLAHHAALGGDAATAARAALRAAQRCLRVFAAAAAAGLARRGMHQAAQLPAAEGVTLQLELAEVLYAAHRPADPAAAARDLEALAQQALGLGSLAHARLGFHLVSYLGWEGGNWSDAQRQMLRAEEISRAADEPQRVVALAEAAHCLLLLDRDLPHARALVLEAQALAGKLGIEPAEIVNAIGMLRWHEGRLDEAAERFARARDLAQRAENRLEEFRALECVVMVELQRGRLDAARAAGEPLSAIAARLREGSEAPQAEALAALIRYAESDDAAPALEAALARLRAADAKQRLAYALLGAAEADLRRGAIDSARARAEEALRLAEALQRGSDALLARVAIARAAELAGDAAEAARQRAALAASDLGVVSQQARAAAASLDTPRLARRGRTR
jgi:DNA-binding SARP family transcriptional activator